MSEYDEHPSLAADRAEVESRMWIDDGPSSVFEVPDAFEAVWLSSRLDDDFVRVNPEFIGATDMEFGVARRGDDLSRDDMVVFRSRADGEFEVGVQDPSCNVTPDTPPYRRASAVLDQTEEQFARTARAAREGFEAVRVHGDGYVTGQDGLLHRSALDPEVQAVLDRARRDSARPAREATTSAPGPVDPVHTAPTRGADRDLDR